MLEQPHMYDIACYDLAENFLSDEPFINTDENRRELAQQIQDVIEDFILAHTSNPG